MSEFDVVQRPAQPYAAIRVTVPMEQLGTAVPPLNSEVFAWLAERGVAPVGPPFWKYDVVRMPGAMTIEAGVATDRLLPSDERVTTGELPAGAYVETTYRGHPDGLLDVTAALLAYGDERGLRFDHHETPDGDVWAARLELYLTDPADEPDLHQWETTLAFKLAD